MNGEWRFNPRTRFLDHFSSCTPVHFLVVQHRHETALGRMALPHVGDAALERIRRHPVHRLAGFSSGFQPRRVKALMWRSRSVCWAPQR